LVSSLFAKISVFTNSDELKVITQQELAKLYLKKINKINNLKIVVFDSKKDYNEFYKKIIKKTPSQIHAYWMKQIFLGKRIPPKKLTLTQIKKRLKTKSNIIVYSSENLHTKVIYEIK
jgi:hypothetical protein